MIACGHTPNSGLNNVARLRSNLAEDVLGARRTGYREIAAVLFAWMSDGRYRPGQQIPTEAELCAEFNVSRVTIRRALALLIARGALESRQGTGSFVSNSYKRPPPRHDVKLLGPHPGIWQEDEVFRFVGSDVIRTTKADQEFFGAEVKSVEEFRYLRLRNKSPAYYLAFQYADWVADLIEDRSEGVLLHLQSYLVERGVCHSHTHQGYSAVIADKRMAEILNVGVGDPLLRQRSMNWDMENRPYLRGLWHYRADAYELKLEISATAAQRGTPFKPRKV